MGSRLFVGNLAYATTEESLRRFFDNGQREVVEVRIIADRETGRSRGFGFVELGSEEQAKAAIAELDGAELEGRPVQIKEALERGAGGGRGAGVGRGGPPREYRGSDRPGRPAGGLGRRDGGGDGAPPWRSRPPRAFEPPPDPMELEGRGGGRAERERRRNKRKKKSRDPDEDDW